MTVEEITYGQGIEISRKIAASSCSQVDFNYNAMQWAAKINLNKRNNDAEINNFQRKTIRSEATPA